MKTTFALPSPCRFYHHCSSSSSRIMAKSKNSRSSSNKDSDTPRRITSNVKQNLQCIKLWKEYQANKSRTPKPVTRFRRKKMEKEDLPKELKNDPNMNIDDTYEDLEIVEARPVMLVDGYNVCGYWPKLKDDFMCGKLDLARQMLVTELITFSAMREVKVVVVFDAMRSGRRTHKERFAGIDIVFAGETSADFWIEEEIVALKEDGCPIVWVVTNDWGERQGSILSGALIWSCDKLISEIKASEKEFEIRQRELRSHSVQGKLLMHNLPPKVVTALKDLRKTLPHVLPKKKKKSQNTSQ